MKATPGDFAARLEKARKATTTCDMASSGGCAGEVRDRPVAGPDHFASNLTVRRCEAHA